MDIKYPVYVISKGRFENCLTAKFLLRDKVPFHLVVEPQEFDEYASRYGKKNVFKLPFSNLGFGSIPARNWVWEHSKKIGVKRHWILDDNILGIYYRFRAKRFYCHSVPAFHYTENFVDRYTNIAIGGLNYGMFLPDRTKYPPYNLNVHVYSCLLILNELPYRWRGRYNEDTDLCLQVLSGDWCTVLMNVFTISKKATMNMKGGNFDQLYKGDGRLKMARSLERLWPGVVETKRRFDRPQHVINDGWRNFDTQLVRRDDIDWDKIENEKISLKLVQKQEIKSEGLRKLIGDRLQKDNSEEK